MLLDTSNIIFKIYYPTWLDPFLFHRHHLFSMPPEYSVGTLKHTMPTHMVQTERSCNIMQNHTVCEVKLWIFTFHIFQRWGEPSTKLPLRRLWWQARRLMPETRSDLGTRQGVEPHDLQTTPQKTKMKPGSDISEHVLLKTVEKRSLP